MYICIFFLGKNEQINRDVKVVFEDTMPDSVADKN